MLQTNEPEDYDLRTLAGGVVHMGQLALCSDVQEDEDEDEE